MRRPDIALVAALNERRAIGRDNALLWKLPRDMKHFRSLTLDRPVIMGRSTFESIGRPLPRRRNIVMTRQSGVRFDGCETAHSLDAALTAAGDARVVMVIGGDQIYRLFLPLATHLHLTHVRNDLDGDAFFPELDSSWKVTEEALHPADAENAYECSFKTYQRS